MTTAIRTTAIITRLSDDASKAEELAVWREFRNTLPPCSYLALYLDGSDEVLQNAMAVDMSTELLSAIRRNRMEALQAESDACKARDKARAERDAMALEVKALRHAATQLRDELRDLSQAAQTLAVQAAKSYQQAVSTVVDQGIRANKR